MDHLRYSGLPFETQRTAFLGIIAADPLLAETLARARALALPDWLVASGALYNSVWNHLTGKPPGYGIKDVDLFYFDDADLSYEAEDTVIRRAAAHFEGLPLPVEVRNQARVHLWYPVKFGEECPRYASSSESVSYFASKTHAVGVRYGADGALELVAPFGLDYIFSFRITPNRALDNQRTHEAKGRRARECWPEIEVMPW
ncbi:nucleotidyltransferase family protein [Mesorhizobium sp. M2A.F.Ca.ET.037.01.1.1]|uniref:nucleotidyltransferase family protein n=1 Tax=unclassified Mesorhizobium TaxID=325217 RepID=UPI000F756FAD|nr:MULTISPECIES: nucleotidyltransferase family protein [unclassified Mesorhizobium]RUY05092.1 nucleotidyltransferase family protein [Mesorhizobium sp. M2A.F.Ca.ET.040.01.1.1]RVC69178.1 nucleotidyltransferase family protein [Mesorhizobium sp. M00.F.Ca.ET.038.03.1.1]RVC74885.1 nucleotidyltransferase family protein [Mesorhizobium sp. M2A.F.Ca.ET.046.02.1.1]AZO35372.1 nucleotidyltransferase family protein [Mesorhizobium sp. M2A.F.Ca.ET.046.03.2.1]RUX22886.1 nucleotidyltransferase family protein [M